MFLNILKAKKSVSMQLKLYLLRYVLPYLLRYVPDRSKSQQMCDKATLENGGTLKSFLDCYKN